MIAVLGLNLRVNAMWSTASKELQHLQHLHPPLHPIRLFRASFTHNCPFRADLHARHIALIMNPTLINGGFR
jgi:hypothetical protein